MSGFAGRQFRMSFNLGCLQLGFLGGTMGAFLGGCNGLARYIFQLQEKKDETPSNTFLAIGADVPIGVSYIVGGTLIGAVAGATFPVSAPLVYLAKERSRKRLEETT